jgi:hypothetical protein
MLNVGPGLAECHFEASVLYHAVTLSKDTEHIHISYAHYLWWSEFLTTDQEVPSSIPSTTGFPEK